MMRIKSNSPSTDLEPLLTSWLEGRYGQGVDPQVRREVEWQVQVQV